MARKATELPDGLKSKTELRFDHQGQLEERKGGRRAIKKGRRVVRAAAKSETASSFVVDIGPMNAQMLRNPNTLSQ